MRLDYYWELTPNQFKKYVEAYQKKKKMEIEELDASNYNLGKYIAIAFHEPKRYPKKPFLYQEQKTSKNMTIDEMESVARLNTRIMGGTIK